MTKNLSKKRAAAGRLGGNATKQKHGREHYSRIGKLGAHTTRTRYRLEPIGQSGFAMVHRETGEVRAFVNYIPGM